MLPSDSQTSSSSVNVLQSLSNTSSSNAATIASLLHSSPASTTTTTTTTTTTSSSATFVSCDSDQQEYSAADSPSPPLPVLSSSKPSSSSPSRAGYFNTVSRQRAQSCVPELKRSSSMPDDLRATIMPPSLPMSDLFALTSPSPPINYSPDLVAKDTTFRMLRKGIPNSNHKPKCFWSCINNNYNTYRLNQATYSQSTVGVEKQFLHWFGSRMTCNRSIGVMRTRTRVATLC
jgi:hypothetical protein